MLLHDQAWAVGHRVRDLALGEVRIKADSSRGAQPGSQARAGAGGGDTLVLFGTAVAMEQAEQRLLEGR